MAGHVAQDDFRSTSSTRALWSIGAALRPGLINRPVVFGFLLLSVDVLLVSRYQPGTAMAILTSTAPLSLLAGVAINVLPLAMSTIVLVLWTLSIASALQGTEPSKAVSRAAAAVGLYLVAVVALDPRLYPSPGWGEVGLALFAVALLVGRKTEGRGLLDFLTPLAVIVGLALAGASLASNEDLRAALDRPYLPVEQIDLGPGRSVVGYVLEVGQSGQWTTILVEQTRAVSVVPSAEVLHREACLLPGQQSYRPRLPLVRTATPAQVPACRL
jgi:hypothetical protein